MEKRSIVCPQTCSSGRHKKRREGERQNYSQLRGQAHEEAAAVAAVQNRLKKRNHGKCGGNLPCFRLD